MRFINALGTPGGKTALIAFLWLTLLLLVFTVRISHIELDPEGRAMIADTSKILLGILIYSMGGPAPAPPSPPAKPEP